MQTSLDLLPFCSSDPTRTALAQPWTRDGFTYATDGRILIRVPARADIPENPDAPKVGPDHFPFDHHLILPERWMPVPSNLPMPRTVTCRDCGGKGFAPDVPGVKSAISKCDECDGEGTWHEPNGVDLGQQKVSEIYLALIAKELPSPLLAPNVVPIETAIPLKFTGGLGYLMPMRKSQIIK